MNIDWLTGSQFKKNDLWDSESRKNDWMSTSLCRDHSTQTLLLWLLSDFYGATDSDEITLLALFDAHSFFDSADQYPSSCIVSLYFPWVCYPAYQMASMIPITMQ